MCCLVLATHTGSSFGYPKLIKGSSRLKFEGLLYYFMLKLAGQLRVYAASLLYIYIYIYIKGDVCLCVCLSVCLYHHSGQTSRWISLKLGMMIGFDTT